MRWIVGTSIRARRFVAVLAVGMIVFGVVQLRHMPVDVLPEFSPPTVEVQTEALGLSAPEVEQLITVPLEQDLLDGVAWLDTIHSDSSPGLSRIEMIFEPGTDILQARQVVQERLSQAAGLPNVSLPPQMIQPPSSTGRIMMVRLSSQQLSPIETTGNALWASPLSFVEASTPGTGGFIDAANQRLSIQHLQPITTARARRGADRGAQRDRRAPVGRRDLGERLKMPQVQLDPDRLSRYDVSLEQVMEVTANALDAGILHDGRVPGGVGRGLVRGGARHVDRGRAGRAPRRAHAGEPADGHEGLPAGWAPAIGFNDTAQVTQTGLQQVCVPLACYDDVLLTREWNPTERQSFQLKYYAEGVGSVKVGFAGAKEKDHERPALASVTQLDADAMVRERAHALELDTRAYEASTDVYGKTPPSKTQ